MWTHLTNLLETESPHKQAIRDVLENELLRKEFSMDRRKFSRNYELSFFSDKFNLGGVYENNVIWSPSSFIPRFASQFCLLGMGRLVELVYVSFGNGQTSRTGLRVYGNCSLANFKIPDHRQGADDKVTPDCVVGGRTNGLTGQWSQTNGQTDRVTQTDRRTDSNMYKQTGTLTDTK